MDSPGPERSQSARRSEIAGADPTIREASGRRGRRFKSCPPDQHVSAGQTHDQGNCDDIEQHEEHRRLRLAMGTPRGTLLRHFDNHPAPRIGGSPVTQQQSVAPEQVTDP